MWRSLNKASVNITFYNIIIKIHVHVHEVALGSF